jgi:phosphatidylglycerophosphate synthase
MRRDRGNRKAKQIVLINHARALTLPPRALLWNAGWQLALGGVALLAIGVSLAASGILAVPSVIGALLAYGLVALLVLVGLAQHAPHRRFGAANAITLIRATYICFLLGLMADRVLSEPELRWLLAAIGGIALLLDGADGWMARRTGLATPFGARFDMEVDALFVLALAILVYATGRAGLWVLASGLMRYAFILASWIWPVLAAPLPPRFWRKAICVVQIVLLLLALAPLTGPATASVLCLLGLILLTCSFAADCVQLLGLRPVARLTT